MNTLRFDVFGRKVLVVASSNGWVTFYVGTEGKRRSSPDIVIPPDLPESEISQYLDDLCHEWATDQHPHVKQIE
ncbi:MAG: hypothetical protein JSU67_01660 [Gammaproteobacteria bacterium]|nr:MAG: hypothetical protein JSU67_01660 [Gammaproteobacteria bacterium]